MFLAIGDGVFLALPINEIQQWSCNYGDKVLFGKYSGTEIKIDGEEFLIMREEEVLGIVKK